MLFPRLHVVNESVHAAHAMMFRRHPFVIHWMLLLKRYAICAKLVREESRSFASGPTSLVSHQTGYRRKRYEWNALSYQQKKAQQEVSPAAVSGLSLFVMMTARR